MYVTIQKEGNPTDKEERIALLQSMNSDEATIKGYVSERKYDSDVPFSQNAKLQ